ncbi:MAG: VCBS repeat-containing protein, partial [Deltaproteobacteria bacterium]|nr:VCBS repeat-containing protein [Deltaproteobacteria bacterium]
DSLDASFDIVGNADYDGDGYADLLARDPGTGDLEIRLLENGQTVETGGFDIESSWKKVVGSADYDGNGYADFLLRHSRTDELVLWSLHGTEVLEIVRLPNADDDAKIVGSGDYDGNGRHDILWLRPGGRFRNSALFVWYLDDPAHPEEEEIPDIDSGWEYAATGDYDGDGNSDVLLRDLQNGDLRMYLFGSSTVSEESFSDNSGYFPSGNRDDYTVVSSADFDGDGRCDIALRHTRGDLLLLYMEGSQAQGGLLLDGFPESLDGVGLENPTID